MTATEEHTEAAYAQSRHLGASKGCFGVRATEVHMEAEYMQANSFARSRQLGASSGRPSCTIEVSRCKLGPLSRQSDRRALGGGVHASERICTIEASRCMSDMFFSLHCDHSRLLDACSGCAVHNRGFSVHSSINVLCTIEVTRCMHREHVDDTHDNYAIEHNDANADDGDHCDGEQSG